MIKSARIFRRYIQEDYETRYQKQVEMIPQRESRRYEEKH
jgi:hypothetical protein